MFSTPHINLYRFLKDYTWIATPQIKKDKEMFYFIYILFY